MAGRSLGQAVATVSLSVALASVAVRSSGCRGVPASRYPVSRAGCGSPRPAFPGGCAGARGLARTFVQLRCSVCPHGYAAGVDSQVTGVYRAFDCALPRVRVNTDACHGDTCTVGVSTRHRLLGAGTAGLGPRSFCWANGWESCKPASVESSTPGSVAVVLALPSLEHKRPHFRLDISQEADCQ